jgi:hypothetical protein
VNFMCNQSPEKLLHLSFYASRLPHTNRVPIRDAIMSSRLPLNKASNVLKPLLHHHCISSRFDPCHKQPGCRYRCRSYHTAGTADSQLKMLTPRQYQRELIELLKDTNAIVTLPTGPCRASQCAAAWGATLIVHWGETKFTTFCMHST